MASDEVLDRITAWQTAGLIDEATGERLRAAEMAHTASGPGARRPGRLVDGVGSFFGPIPSIVELFAYLGSGFVLAAWHALNLSTGAGSNVIEWLGPAAALGIVGAALMGRGERERRAAGVAFAVVTVHIYGAALQALSAPGTGGPSAWDARATGAATAAAVAALGLRRILPAVVTQLALLGALSGVAGAGLAWLGDVVFPAVSPGYDYPPATDPNAMARVIAASVWWLAWAVAFGVMGLWEARREIRLRGDSPDAGLAPSEAGRRASVTRVAAGLVAVVGVTTAIMTRDYVDMEYSRVLAPWLGDGLVLAISMVLLALAVRRGATAYLYPAAIGFIVALSDLNGSYVAEQTGVALALLVEGLILIGAGVLAERLRRRLATGDSITMTPRVPPSGPTAATPPTPAG